MRTPLQRILFVFGLMTILLALGTLAFHWVEGWTLFDSFYMTLMTVTTVGYGEIHPMSQSGRIVAAAVMMAGVAAVFIAIGLLVDLLIKLELADHFGRKRRQQMLDKLNNHYIVCGAGRVGRSVVRELRRSGAPLLLIDSNPERAQWGIEEGIPTLVADATEDDTLRRAHVELAKGLVAAISSDAENVYVTLSARVLNPDLIISARASEEQAEKKLRRAGATTVFTPYTFIGHRLAQSMLRPDVLNFLDVASAFTGSTELDVETEQVLVGSESPWCERTLEEARIRQAYGVIVLAIKKASGAMVFSPHGDMKIETNDVLIAMGERSQLIRMRSDAKVQKSVSTH
jgi:voltage-gated potassium channel